MPEHTPERQNRKGPTPLAAQRASAGATLFWPLGFAALAILSLAGLAVGAVALALPEVVAAFVGDAEPATREIVRGLRAPRVVLAILVGASLGTSGAALQGALRNALAEPYLLGVSGGAAVGAVLALSMGAAVHPATVPLASFGGALLATALVLLVARAGGGRADTRTLLMAGVVTGAFTNAVIAVVHARSEGRGARGALWWMLGSLSDASWGAVLWLGGALLVAGGALMLLADRIDLLALGDEAAAALGIDPDRSGQAVFILSSLLAAATVAVVGLVGFIGLVVPHIARASGMRRHRALLPASALGGSILTIGADLAARALLPPTELPLGAITALVGVPFFLAQLKRYA